MLTNPRPGSPADYEDSLWKCAICGVPWARRYLEENDEGKLVCPDDADEVTRTELAERYR